MKMINQPYSLTPAEINGLEVLHAASTQGKWSADQSHGMDCVWTDIYDENQDEIVGAEILPRVEIVHSDFQAVAEAGIEQAWANLQCIAALHNAFPALIATVRALEAERRMWEEGIDLSNEVFERAIAERDTANARAEKAEEELNNHVGKQALKEMLRQMVETAEERDQLAADNVRLREALDNAAKMLDSVRENFVCTGPNCASGDCELAQELVSEIRAAVSATPAQSLAKVKADALRDATKLICNERAVPHLPSTDAVYYAKREITILLNAEADRLEAGDAE